MNNKGRYGFIWLSHTTTQAVSQSASQQSVKPPGEPAKQTDSASFRQHPELLYAGLFHFRGSPLVYFFIGKGFGCYQAVAAQYQTHVWLVNRQLAALQAPHSVQRGRARRSAAVTLIPPLSLPDSPR
ncbi:hypothetical protein PBY51_008919 [Eleginops maclovinus]|uniref:Uncharacterized protein n=1 Tax=Eleginops maclovinus TaxID=56733 RepID=A0AAN8ABU9_ELEMC|nr:hypothetical protein PBY51_008919 [Eleginops maclovinus]